MDVEFDLDADLAELFLNDREFTLVFRKRQDRRFEPRIAGVAGVIEEFLGAFGIVIEPRRVCEPIERIGENTIRARSVGFRG
nr:hypothetical protein [Halorubrum cibi]